MLYVQSNGALLYAEETGKGTAIVFVHEFAGDLRNWEPAIRVMARRYRCIAFNARGYPPSDVPRDVSQYSQSLAVEDILNTLDHFDVETAHVVGLSMGGYATLNFGIQHPERTRSLTICGAGHGSDSDKREKFLADSDALAERLLRLGIEEGMSDYMSAPARRRFAERDPRACQQFMRQLAEHSALGSALTIRGCQLRRPTIYELGDRMDRICVPALIITGDDDEACIEPALFMKRQIADARLWVMPRVSHNVNLEEPEAFNRVVLDFIDEAEANLRIA
ncbi:alpha/beta hydrolase [Bosea sp. Tri-44]|uniref:alpha/beta fold hydrolase n=1 Tax=Bosea sp. Tri-44 TaxID=1972137 RepID=UPI00100E141B|nr:alpha/beta hydrolase [Bosea sp. Tri-44]RXT51229.1 alpha/beta hydrolase [Bosea sp. Tri-44]